MDSITHKAELQISSAHGNVVSNDVKSFLLDLINKSLDQDAYSKPMPWIGMYIALASLICILLMAADELHGFCNRKLWFPPKYFTLNAFSLTVIAAAMKLPVDLTSPMPGDTDQNAKIASLVFMCIMMAKLMPSIATMDNMELLTNSVALGVLVITLIVNVCIEINTGVVVPRSYAKSHHFWWHDDYRTIAIIYVAMLLMLLIIHACSALAVLKTKQILESKYQTTHQTASPQSERLTVERLKQHVTNHWVMAETGSPQFTMACSATTSATGVICMSSFVLLGGYGIRSFVQRYDEPDEEIDLKHYKSDYKWSTSLIFYTQWLGIALGIFARGYRCLAYLRFKTSPKWISNPINVFKVESYWTQKLCDWKQSSIPFSISNRKSKIVIHNFKILILSFCIGFQMIIVVACKIITLIQILFLFCLESVVLCCIPCFKLTKAKFSAPVNVLEGNSEQLENNQDRRRYVLQLQDDMEVADRTLDIITKSVKRLIQKAEKQQPNQLIKFLQKSEDFEGVRRYASHLFSQNLPAEEYLDSWSLPLVTLTIMAISLINFQKDEFDNLLSSVSEGLAFVTHVEESLNTTDEYVRSQKAAKLLWIEVEFSQKWLGIKLKNTISQLNTTKHILEWFRNTAKNIITEVVGMDIEVSNEKLVSRSICAYSMYCITESLLHSHQDHINEVTQQKLFEELSLMIAHIMASCLTNLPQVIVMKCHTNVIEKREASVYAAVQLLGKTTQIIDSFKVDKIPSLNPDELAFFDKWCAYYFHQSIP